MFEGFSCLRSKKYHKVPALKQLTGATVAMRELSPATVDKNRVLWLDCK